MGLAVLKPLVAEGSLEVFEFLADLVKVLDRERLVEAGEFVDGGGDGVVELTAVVVLGFLRVSGNSLFALLTAHFLLACAFSLFTFLGCIGVALLLNQIRHGVLFGRVDGVLHASELGAYLVEEFGERRTAFIHRLESAFRLVNVVGTAFVQFIGHAGTLYLVKKILAEVGATHG